LGKEGAREVNEMASEAKPTGAAVRTSLKGRVAFITGAGSGIGRAGAFAMARCGAHVVVSDRDGDLAARVLEEIESEGYLGSSRRLDVSDDAALETAILDTAKSMAVLISSIPMLEFRLTVHWNRLLRRGWMQAGR
jgi:FlaA1/EpsC-like NDP-sugar epimerase